MLQTKLRAELKVAENKKRGHLMAGEGALGDLAHFCHPERVAGSF